MAGRWTLCWGKFLALGWGMYTNRRRRRQTEAPQTPRCGEHMGREGFDPCSVFPWDCMSPFSHHTNDVPFPPRRAGEYRKGMISARPLHQAEPIPSWACHQQCEACPDSQFFHEVRHSIGFVTLSGSEIESPRPPILIVRLENLAGKLHCGHVLRISSGIFPLTPSGFNVRNPLVKCRRVKFCRGYEGSVFGNSISNSSWM